MKRNAFVNSIVKTIYGSQKNHSKIRKHEPPHYGLSELRDWFYSQTNLELLLSEWKDSGYNKMFKPSIDRLDDSKGYSFDNIQLVTWGYNISKGSHKKKKVVSILNGIQEFYDSIDEAATYNGISKGGISDCCNGNRKTAGGFRWEFI